MKVDKIEADVSAATYDANGRWKVKTDGVKDLRYSKPFE